MDPLCKKSLQTSIITFYTMHRDERKFYTYKKFKDCGYSQRGILAILKRFDMNVVQKMFENLKGKIHEANRNGLSSLK